MSNGNRTLRLFYYFSQNSGVVTSEELSKYIGVSVRTIKNDMEALSRFCQASGCELVTKRGSGYQLHITDLQNYREVAETISHSYSDYTFTTEYRNRSRDIARVLLVSDGYIKIDDLADRMFLSRSTIKNSIKDARKLLNGFNLTIDSRPGYGIQLQGEEINRRFCMLELFLSHDLRAMSPLPNTTYREYFDTDISSDELENVRHAMLKVLRESERTILDADTHRIVRYLFMMKNRNNRGYRLTIPEGYREKLKLFPEYRIAGNIVSSEKELLPDLPESEDEIIGLAVLLLLFNDPYDYSDIQERFPEIMEKSRQLSDRIFQETEERWNISLKDYFEDKNFIANLMVPDVIRHRFSEIAYVKIGKDIENNGISASPLSLALAKSALETIGKEFGNSVHNAEVLSLAIRLYVGIDRIRFTYHKPKILVASRAGKQACQIVINKMTERFGKDRFESIEPIGFYEVRRLNQDDYDWMVVNYNNYYYHYSIPYIYVDAIPTPNQIENIHEMIVLGSYDLKSVLKSLSFRPDFIFRNFNYSNRENFIGLLAMRNARLPIDVHHLQEEMLKMGDIFVWQETAFVIIDTQYTKRNILEIYSLDKKGIWVHKEIRHVVFMSVDFHGDPQQLKFVEKLINAIAVDPTCLKQIMEDDELDSLSEIVRKML